MSETAIDANADEIIRTVDLTKQYPSMDVPALDQLNLKVHRGEIFGLLGPNGAGKTTTAGILTTRVVPTSGSAFVAGIDVRKHPALVKQVSGIVSQQNTLDRQLTVWENLYFHGRFFGINSRDSKQKADELLETFNLSKWAKASVYALSGGMAQRLALWDMLVRLNGEGQTVVLTTHYMEEADKLCQRVAILDNGKVLALDTPANLKRSTGADTIVTIKVIGDPQLLADVVARDVPGVVKTRVGDGTVQVHVQGTDRLVPSIVNAAENANLDVIDLAVAEPSLETVFINLTGKELRE